MSLRARLAVAAAVLLAAAVGAGLLVIVMVDSFLLRQADQNLNSVIPVAVALTETGSASIPPTPGSLKETAFSEIYVATVTGGVRRTVVTPAGAGGRVPVVPSRVSSPLGSLHPSTVASERGSQRWRAVDLATPGSSTQLLVAISLASADATSRRVLLAVLGALGVLVVVLAAAGFWVARLGLRPLSALGEVADAIVSGDRSRRVPPAPSGTEAARVARAFNVMLDEEQALQARLRQFVADASHELRSPVTAIQGVTELWRRGRLRDGPELADAMRRTGQESARMARLVEDLLMLARLDERRPLRAGPVDLRALTGDVIATVTAAFPDRIVTVADDAPAVVLADEDMARQVVTNLVRNALVHTASAVRVSVATGEGVCTLAVADDGPGMSEEQLAHAFDRFWRADPSRSGRGSGLGLSIVAAIVNAHGGSVSIRSTPAEGTEVGVTLPAPDVAPS